MPIEGKIPNTYKKSTQRGWYSKWERLDPRGKSSKEKTLMIKELVSQRNTYLSAIKTLKYVIQKQKELYQYKASLKQGKIRRRNARLEETKEELKEREKELRSRERKIERLIAKLDDKSGTISELEKELNKEGTFNYTLNELNTWKSKYDDLNKRYRRLQMRKRYKPVKKVVVEKEELTAEEKKIKRLAEKPVSEKEYKINTIAESTLNFLKERSMSLELLSCITRLNAIPKLMKKELQLTEKQIHKGEDLGLLSGEYVGAVQNRKYYYITPKGRELVQEYIEYIKKSKSSLI